MLTAVGVSLFPGAPSGQRSFLFSSFCVLTPQRNLAPTVLFTYLTASIHKQPPSPATTPSLQMPSSPTGALILHIRLPTLTPPIGPPQPCTDTPHGCQPHPAHAESPCCGAPPHGQLHTLLGVTPALPTSTPSLPCTGPPPTCGCPLW